LTPNLSPLPFYSATGTSIVSVNEGSYLGGLETETGTTPLFGVISRPAAAVHDVFTFDPICVGHRILVTYHGTTSSVNSSVSASDFAFGTQIGVNDSTEVINSTAGYTFQWLVTVNDLGGEIVISTNGTETANVGWGFSMTFVNLNFVIDHA